MKRIILGVVLLGSSITAHAVAPGGSDCGWGNMIFEGQSGLPMHFIALTTNASSNQTFGMTSGTNGCSTSGTLTYGGKAMVDLSMILDEFIEDAARGQGEALTAMAVSMGVEPNDREAFSAAVHQNFDVIFANSEVTAEAVMVSLIEVMKSDKALSKYVS